MPAFVLTLLMLVIEINFTKHSFIGFTYIQNIDILVNNIIKSIQLLMAMCNWYAQNRLQQNKMKTEIHHLYFYFDKNNGFQDSLFNIVNIGITWIQVMSIIGFTKL